MLVKGVKHNQGKFTDRKTGNEIEYENFMLYGLDDNGEWTHEKVPAKVMKEAGVYASDVLVDNKIEIYYNRYGSVSQIRIAG